MKEQAMYYKVLPIRTISTTLAGMEFKIFYVKQVSTKEHQDIIQITLKINSVKTN